MRYLLAIPAYILFIAGLAACQPANSTELVADNVEPQVVTTELISESIQTPTLAPALTSEDITMVSPITPDATAQKMVNLTKEHLAQRLGIPVDQIALLEVKPAQWRDAGLGCPKPGVDYIQMETPGYKIVLETGGKTYNYHTDVVNRFVMCNRQ